MPRNVLCSNPVCYSWVTSARLDKGFTLCSKCQRKKKSVAYNGNQVKP